MVLPFHPDGKDEDVGGPMDLDSDSDSVEGPIVSWPLPMAPKVPVQPHVLPIPHPCQSDQSHPLPANPHSHRLLPSGCPLPSHPQHPSSSGLPPHPCSPHHSHSPSRTPFFTHLPPCSHSP